MARTLSLCPDNLAFSARPGTSQSTNELNGLLLARVSPSGGRPGSRLGRPGPGGWPPPGRSRRRRVSRRPRDTGDDRQLRSVLQTRWPGLCRPARTEPRTAGSPGSTSLYPRVARRLRVSNPPELGRPSRRLTDGQGQAGGRPFEGEREFSGVSAALRSAPRSSRPVNRSIVPVLGRDQRPAFHGKPQTPVLGRGQRPAVRGELQTLDPGFRPGHDFEWAAALQIPEPDLRRVRGVDLRLPVASACCQAPGPRR